MKQLFFLSTLACFLLNYNVVFGQIADTIIVGANTIQSDTISTSSESIEYVEEDDFSPGLFFFMLAGLALILISVGCGIALTVMGLLIVFGLISFGVLSTSIIIGLNKKSFATGFKTFIILASTIGGLLVGAVSFWLLNKILHWSTVQTAIISGATCGFLSGLLWGLLGVYVLKRLTNYFKTKLNLE